MLKAAYARVPPILQLARSNAAQGILDSLDLMDGENLCDSTSGMGITDGDTMTWAHAEMLNSRGDNLLTELHAGICH